MKMTNQFEVEAYEKIFTRDEGDERYMVNLVFQKFLPRYYGAVTPEE